MTADEPTLQRVARALALARTVAVLTGAGMSAESGVPTFRGTDGLWRTFRPEQLATPEAFARDPGTVWEWYRWRRSRMAAVAPNPGHLALARLEARFSEFTVVTQNIDGLHARAGSREIIELHGNIWRDRCTANVNHLVVHRPDEPIAGGASGALPRCHCGAVMRPDVVWFGEALDPVNTQRACDAVRRADVVLVVGTSSVVYPAASLPGLARQAGAYVVEINPEETPLSREMDAVLRGPSGVVLPSIEGLLSP